MKYNIITIPLFNKQVRKLDDRSRRLIHRKIQILKTNPYRYKKLNSNEYRKLFRIRLNINKQKMRLIYEVVEPDVIIICLLQRKGNYKELEKYL